MKKLLTTHCHLFVCLLLFVIFGLYPKGVSATTSLANQFTVSLWVNPTGSVVSKALAVNDSSIRVFTDASGFANCQIYTSSWQTGAVGTVALSLSTWTHVACTYDKATIRLYINGVAQGTTPAQTGTVNDSGNVWKVGQDAGGTYGDLTGTIDDVRFYDYARTAKQIIEDMNAGHPAPGSPVGSSVGWWKFDEGRDNSCTGGVNDACNSGSGGSALDGAQSGMAVPATSTSGWTNSGKFGKALNFVTDDYVTIPYNGTSTPGGLTVSGWYKTTTISGSDGVLQWATTLGSGNPFIYLKRSGATFVSYVDNVYQTASPTIAVDTWYHYVFSMTSANVWSFYMNGELISTYDAGASNLFQSNATTFFLGDGWDGYFAGSIDEVKIYNYALTSDEVKTEYNQGKSVLFGSLGNNSGSASNAAAQLYCVPGDATSCAAPVAEWKMDEFTGTSAYDTSGNGNTGTLGAGNSAPTWTAGKQGSGLKFDGNNDFVSLPTSSTNASRAQVTITAWVKASSFSTTPEIYAEQTSTNSNCRICLAITTAGKVILVARDSAADPSGSAFSLTGNTALSTGTWYHVAAVYDSTNDKHYLYVNGVVDVSSTTALAALGSSATNGIAIGRDVAGANQFNGTIDNVRVFNYARTAAQIAWDYNRGAPVAHYKFDECNGGTAYDASGNANNGTITVGASGTQTAVGDCTTSATTMWNGGATGKFNSSLNFDGTDDYVGVGTSVPMNSVSFWVKPTSNTASMINLTSGAYISASSGTITATGFTSPTYYVNGLSTTSPTLTANAWNHIVVTTATSITANALTIGKANGAYTAGQIDDTRIYNYALTPLQVKTVMNEGFAVRYGPSSGQP